LKLLETLGIKTTAQDDHYIAMGWQGSLMITKDLTQHPLAVVTLYRIANTTTGDDTQARTRLSRHFSTQALKNERPAVDTNTLTADLSKIALLTQAL
jgi:hypothetical protein